MFSEQSSLISSKKLRFVETSRFLRAKSQVEQVPFSQVAFSKASQIGPGSLGVLVKKQNVSVTKNIRKSHKKENNSQNYLSNKHEIEQKDSGNSQEKRKKHLGNILKKKNRSAQNSRKQSRG